MITTVQCRVAPEASIRVILPRQVRRVDRIIDRLVRLHIVASYENETDIRVLVDGSQRINWLKAVLRDVWKGQCRQTPVPLSMFIYICLCKGSLTPRCILR